jgi:hypothetical protein
MKKLAFSKKLLIADYVIFVVLVVCATIFQSVDFTSIIVAWIVQLGISSGAYYWKAKNDNRTKVPIKVIQSLPPEVRDQIDLTQVITSIIESE